MTHGKQPYGQNVLARGLPSLVRAVVKGTRPDIPETCDKTIKELITRCWAADQNERPDFSEVS